MTKLLKVSEVRKHIYDLFAEVVENPRARVVITHRDATEQAVLLSRSELARLEQRAATSSSGFSLFGSATLQGAPEDVLADVRREQRDLGGAKTVQAKGKR
jgi:hypothetical protein